MFAKKIWYLITFQRAISTFYIFIMFIEEVDTIRKRISLSMKSNTESQVKPTDLKRSTKKNISTKPQPIPKPQGTIADAIAKAFKNGSIVT
jgi:transcriptional accessory protein Tex/SPT6